MIRFLNFLALSAVIASATWAYSVKYETILVAEKLKKRETELRRERDAIQVLSAEWELLNRPARLSVLAKPEAGMQQLSARQVVNARDIPAAQPAKGDSLDSLLTGSLPPAAPAKAGEPPKVAKVQPGKVQPGKAQPGKATTGKATTTKATTGKPPVGKVPATRATASKAVGDKPDAKVVAVQGAPKAGPLLLTPKTGAPKTGAPKVSAPKVSAPKAVAPVAAAAPKREEGGLNSLFKKILN
jgi:hypothetical protein